MYHIPVLADEVIAALNVKSGGTYVDCTLGGGGHSSLILQKLGAGTLIGFDKDLDAIQETTKRFLDKKNFEAVHADFKQAPQFLADRGIKADGILIDLGVSSHQIDEGERGFSIRFDGALDMRMDRRQALTAFDIVNKYSQSQLEKILREYGEEPNAKNIALRICERRKIAPIETTGQLKEVIESAFPKKAIYTRGELSKQTFQALRIEVNGELDGLEECIGLLISALAPKGRLAVISFHSLEDRIVKSAMRFASTDCICPPKTPICICGHKALGKVLTKKPITATTREVEQNPRSSSAKLRVFERS